jgi:quinol monooxygenase YgiN
VFVRLFQTAVDPTEVDSVLRLFNEDVRPVYDTVEGCRSLELLVSLEPNAGGLVDASILSRWESLELLDASLELRPAKEAMVRVRALLRQEPVIRTYRALE